MLMRQFWSRLLILPDKIIVSKKYICIIRKGSVVECIQPPEEMIEYLEKVNQNNLIN